MEEKNYFQKLYDVDLTNKVKEKNNLKYISWAAAWAELKKQCPDANYIVYENESGRPWFDDGKTAWVKTGVIANGIEHIERLPIMDNRRSSISSDAVTSCDANKSIQRSLTKACGRHGVALYIYEGEDIPENTKELDDLRAECYELAKAKSKLSDSAKEKAELLCSNADDSKDPRQCENSDVLKDLKKKLLAIRK